jgi:hypothetical protein
MVQHQDGDAEDDMHRELCMMSAHPSLRFISSFKFGCEALAIFLKEQALAIFQLYICSSLMECMFL